MITLRIPLALLLWSCLLSVLSAQPAEIEATASSSRRSYETQRILDQAPVIDGDLSDPCWEQVEWGTGFTQLTPADGAAPTQETAFKILYDEKNLYLGFRCHDSSPDSVVSRMSRRDGFEGDWVEVNIDSYHDLRTAFSFTSSVSGVKGDEFVSNNGDNWDSSWNPIWNLKTQVDSLGWTAEVRIPSASCASAEKKNRCGDCSSPAAIFETSRARSGSIFRRIRAIGSADSAS